MPGRVMAALAVAGALMAVAFAARGGSSGATGVKVDLAAVLEDVTGAKVDLAAYAGKPVIINLWATWCGPCRLETPQLVALAEKFKARGITIIGISVDDTAADVRSFAAEFKVTYPMLVGLGHEEFVEKLGYQGVLPLSILVDRNGMEAGRITGLETTADWERRIEGLLK